MTEGRYKDDVRFQTAHVYNEIIARAIEDAAAQHGDASVKAWLRCLADGYREEASIAGTLHQLELIESDNYKALIAERDRLRAELDCRDSMKMYIWTDRFSFLAVAHAKSKQQARELLISDDLGAVGDSGDGSCPERDKAREWVRNLEPSIYQRETCEFALTDSAELRESVLLIEKLEKQLKDARQSAAAGSGVTDQCEHHFVFLRQITSEETWHNFVTFDVFFCDKCLTQKKVEAIKPNASRW